MKMNIIFLSVVCLTEGITFGSADADGVVSLSCIDGPRSVNCMAQWTARRDPHLRAVPNASLAQERTLAARDRKWETRCRPAVTHDGYGVARYQYAAPGCEYGIGSD
jgi:hypothetical protein